jgi:hypothetical protein
MPLRFPPPFCLSPLLLFSQTSPPSKPS